MDVSFGHILKQDKAGNKLDAWNFRYRIKMSIYMESNKDADSFEQMHRLIGSSAPLLKQCFFLIHVVNLSASWLK